MLSLTEKDADFLANIIRELIKLNNESYKDVCEKYVMAEQLVNTFGKGDKNIEQKFKELEEMRDRFVHKYEKRSAEFEKALLLCIAGSDV